MNVHLSQIGDIYDGQAMRTRTEQIEAAFRHTLSTETASPFALLVAPDKSVWKVTVSSTGVLTTAKMPQGVPL